MLNYRKICINCKNWGNPDHKFKGVCKLQLNRTYFMSECNVMIPIFHKKDIINYIVGFSKDDSLWG